MKSRIKYVCYLGIKSLSQKVVYWMNENQTKIESAEGLHHARCTVGRNRAVDTQAERQTSAGVPSAEGTG